MTQTSSIQDSLALVYHSYTADCKGSARHFEKHHMLRAVDFHSRLSEPKKLDRYNMLLAPRLTSPPQDVSVVVTECSD